eukprot:TRINITY_DN413_c0_g4_i1.p1 TRINITY_DN413_c0_g4~~TRINITY_DN413_c0_g4_i1.p1  ORF type:complete len:127 (+),score=23.52 TRINITY_DN413_c0_g4_i1:134-514(+)
MMNHVNNLVFMRWGQSVRVEYYKKMASAGQKFILADQSCSYIRPLTWPDTVVISARHVWVRDSSVMMQYKIESEKVGLAAVGMVRCVAYDFAALRKESVTQETFEMMQQQEHPHTIKRVTAAAAKL